MKKEEAVKMLTNTKVYVNGKSEEIQNKVFELGWEWPQDGKYVCNANIPFLYICENMVIKYGTDMDFFKNSGKKEISAEEILSIEIDEECQFKSYDLVLVRDNDEEARESETDYWNCDMFSHMDTSSKRDYYPYVTLGGCGWMECIPYEGNEHLVGTNKEP